jgi:hypothetical protein
MRLTPRPNVRLALCFTALWAPLLGACGSQAPQFTCADSSQCNLMAGGVCEKTSYCAYPSTNCMSGLKYDPNAGLGLGGTCVPPGDGGSDGSIADAGRGDRPMPMPDGSASDGPVGTVDMTVTGDTLMPDAGLPCVPSCAGGASCVNGACVASACTGVVGLPQPPLVPIGVHPEQVVFADFNGDGIPDLAVPAHNDNSVSVSLGLGAGAYGPYQNIPAGTGVDYAAVGDFNGDGQPDLAVTSGTDHAVMVLLDATPAMGTTPMFNGTPFGTATLPYGVVTGDFDGDGKVDIATVTTPGGGNTAITVLRNTTVKNATAPTFAGHVEFLAGSGGTAVGLATADLNADGAPDLVVAVDENPNAAEFYVAFNKSTVGSMSFVHGGSFYSPTGAAIIGTDVQVGDLNGDNRADVVALDSRGQVVALINQTVGGTTNAAFGSPATLMSGRFAGPLALGDFNGDGALDVAEDYANNQLGVVLNTTPKLATTPTFGTETDYVAPGADGAGAADLDGDGIVDLASVDVADNDIQILLNATPAGAASPTIPDVQSFPTDIAPGYLAIGDLNQDGFPDLAVPNAPSTTADGTVSVLFNTTAPGALISGMSTNPSFDSGGIGGSGAAVGDLNADGMPDVAVANESSDVVGVLLNTASMGATSATFAPVKPFGTGHQPVSVGIADMNMDGLPDLVVPDYGVTYEVSVLLNSTVARSTTPSFAMDQPFLTGNNPIGGPVLADLNADGKPDIAVADDGGTTVTVLLNRTAPGSATVLMANRKDFPADAGGYDIASGDINGDGLPDLVATGDNCLVGSVTVLLNQTTPGSLTPQFAQNVDFQASLHPRSLAVVDVDGDGRPDIVERDNMVGVLLNATPKNAALPIFGPLQMYVGVSQYGTAAGDLNRDGRPDLATTAYGPTSVAAANTVNVMLNRCLH